MSKEELLLVVKVRLRGAGYSEADVEDICSALSDRSVDEIKEFARKIGGQRSASAPTGRFRGGR